jgi:predicted RNase H-like nuclease (RuvC/YqgF family)
VKESEISNLKTILRNKIDHVAKVEVTEQYERRENSDLHDEVERKNRTIQNMQMELDETKKKLDEVVQGRRAEGTTLLGIEHYKTDNERLLNMLATTKEFAEFGKIAADLGTVRYMDPEREEGNKCHPKKKSTLKNFNPGHEMEDWIPEEAFKVAHDFRNKCATQVSPSLMN